MENKRKVERVAKLARIEISEDEKNFLSKQLSKIIDYIDKLKEVDTDDTSPMRDVHPSRNILRQDIPVDSSLRETILNNAPNRHGDYFKIPKVIE